MLIIKVGFNVKYGYNEIDIPVNDGKELFPLNGSGLSNLNNETFTIINQIPQSASVATKRAWTKYTLKGCDKKDGIYDKSSGTMIYKNNSFTAFISDWKHFKAPNWLDNGYYSLTDDEKSRFFTASPQDLIIFADIPDEAPTTTAEFIALMQKYKDIGGLIDGVNVYINYKPNGEPWKINHIELIKG